MIKTSLIDQADEIAVTIEAVCDAMASAITSIANDPDSFPLRQQIATIRSKYRDWLETGTFPLELSAWYVAARLAKADLNALARSRKSVIAYYEDASLSGDISISIVQAAIVFSLGAESIIITEAVFTSRDDVEVMQVRMKDAFGVALDIAADAMDSRSYQTLLYLAGSLANHLATVARPLPRIVNFAMPFPLSTLGIANRIYQDASRAEEIAQENRVIHPAFCPRQIRALSA